MGQITVLLARVSKTLVINFTEISQQALAPAITSGKVSLLFKIANDHIISFCPFSLTFFLSFLQKCTG